MADINRCYELLEIEPGASLEEIKGAYRDLAFVWHPDRFAHNDRLQQKAQQRLIEINQAYEELVLFLSQGESRSIDQQFQQPPPSPPEKPLRRRSGKSANRGGSSRSKTRPKAASPKNSTQNNAKKKKRFTTQNREPGRAKKQFGRSLGKEAWRVQNYQNRTAKKQKEFPTQYSKPRQSQQHSIFPWGSLLVAVASYALTGWILTVSNAPLWMWTLILGTDWLWALILLADGATTSRVWLTALVLAGAVGGAIAGFQAGGTVTAAVWAVFGASLGAIVNSDPESRAVTLVLGVGSVATVLALMAGNGSESLVKVLVMVVCWGIVGLVCGLWIELYVSSGERVGFVGAIGLGMGAWIGLLAGGSSGVLVQALLMAGSKAVYGAWAAIGIIVGVVARIVAAESSIGSGGVFYTFVLSVATSGFGLWLGHWLVDRIF